MNIVVAVDSFKGSLSSAEAGEAVKKGIMKACPQADVYVSPLADGGEGTVDALVSGMGGSIKHLEATGPLGNKISTYYGILPQKQTAVIEMASVAGLPLVPTDKRNPLYTTTYGVGEIILDAIRSGCRHFIVGIGGSATNDGGIGMLQALGFDMLDENGAAIPFGAIGLKSLASIDDVHVLPELKECHFRIACDVKNPLCGQDGCSAVFAPQKGASAAEIVQMDEWLERYAKIAQAKYPRANPQTPGCGAAGGLGFAFCTFMDAALESGIDIVLDEINLEGHIAKADLVITGEGRLDRQTVMGKAPIGVARIAQRYNKPVIAFAGCVTREARVCNEHGIDAFFPILREPVTVQEAMETVTARRNMADTVEQVMRLILRCRKET